MRVYIGIFLATILVGGTLWYGLTLPKINKTASEVSKAAVVQLAPVAPSVSTTSTIVATGTSAPVRVPVFIYHSVYPNFEGETKAQKGFSVTPEELDVQLRYLKDNGYTVVSLDDLERFVAQGTTTVQKPVVLTFDDGWKNEYEYAFPLLKKYGFTATFFIFTNPIGKDKRFMTWEQVLEMDKAGMTIADHTLSHPYLTKMPIEKERQEIFESKKILEEKLGKPVTHFATPFGQTNDILVALLKEAGFTTGRTTFWGASHTKDDLLHLSGYLVERDLKKFIWILEKAK